MRQSFNPDVLKRVSFLIGDEELVEQMMNIPAKAPFDEETVDFLNNLSKAIMKSDAAKAYSDLITFAFWIRKASVLKLKNRFERKDGNLHFGRGVVFHIAPSNVPVNFAYSLVSGLLCGNANIVRVPGKEFTQVRILSNLICEILDKYQQLKSYICLVRYGHDNEVNDIFSLMADVRVVWGGDHTIAELRKSPLQPRSSEITFADRYSLAVIDSDFYLSMEDKKRVAIDFYNDTFFSDQNACTSPRLVVWMGEKREEAKKLFWDYEHDVVKRNYSFQPIQGINKLERASLVAVMESGVRVEDHEDNLIFRILIPRIADYLVDQRENSGFFYEYNCQDIRELVEICNDKRCQTIAYLGDKEILLPLLQLGIKGVDRMVPIGKTMDFDLIWDGYDLTANLTRTVQIL